MKCLHPHDVPATAIWEMPFGCVCFSDRLQPLCEQHALKARDCGVEMRLVATLDVTK
jgi:hypothetical protein